jgi:transposase
MDSNNWRVRDIAARWGVSQNTVTNIFRNEPGVLRIGNSQSGKRQKVTLSVPENVLLRVEQRLSAIPEKIEPKPKKTLRVINLREMRAGKK